MLEKLSFSFMTKILERVCDILSYICPFEVLFTRFLSFPIYREDHQALGTPHNRVGLALSVKSLIVNIFIFLLSF